MRKLMLVGCALVSSAMVASAQTDIGGVVTSVTAYKDAAIVVGIAVLLFVIGRKVVQKLI